MRRACWLSSEQQREIKQNSETDLTINKKTVLFVSLSCLWFLSMMQLLSTPLLGIWQTDAKRQEKKQRNRIYEINYMICAKH